MAAAASEDGDVRRLESYVRANTGQLHALANRLIGDDLRKTTSTEDALQELFVRAHSAIDTFIALGESHPEQLWRWMTALLRNTVVDLARRRRRAITRLETDIAGDLKADGISPSEAAARAQASQELNEKISELDPAEKELIAMYYFEDLTLAQIAQKLDVQSSTLGMRLMRIRKKLRDAMASSSSAYYFQEPKKKRSKGE